jgi:hypothetical protein
MFEIFNSKHENTRDVKGLREALIRFVKEELQKSEGGEGRNIKGLHLFVSSNDEERHIYESAVYYDEPDKLREEIQKIADDFAIDMPDNWELEISCVETLPAEARKVPELNAALFVKTRQHLIQRSAKARIRILNGEAEQEEYIISSDADKINIGREKHAQAADGFFRINTIAFPGDRDNEANKYISRQHAHISWITETGSFMIFADEGGIPPHNKIKIKSIDDETPVRLNSTQIGHVLKERDQIILGESAVIEFSYLPSEA